MISANIKYEKIFGIIFYIYKFDFLMIRDLMIWNNDSWICIFARGISLDK